MYRFRKLIIGLIIFTIQSSIVNNAHARLIFANEIFVNNSEYYEIGSDDDAASTTLTLNFGGINTETIQWDTTKFAISDDIDVTGGITASGTITANGDLTANGLVTLGNGSATVEVNSVDWNISTGGDMTNIGAITMNGLLTGTAGATLDGAAINLNVDSNFVTNIGTGGTTEAVTIGGGSNTVEIATTSWDVSTTGAFTGLTGVTSTGILNFSGAGEFHMRENADPATNSACTTLDELIWDTTSNELQYCTGIGGAGAATWMIDGGEGDPDQDFEGVYSTDAGKDLLVTDALAAAFTIGEGANDYLTIVTTNGSEAVQIDQALNANLALNAKGVTTLGNGSATVEVNSVDWNISTGGDMTNIGAITMNGLLTGTAGATLDGAAINLNVDSNFVTNIGTGGTTEAVTIGGGSNTVEIATTSWDISTAGAATGLTGLTSTGVVSFAGTSRMALDQGSANPGTCTEGDIFYNTTTDATYICTEDNVFTTLKGGGGGVPDFRNFMDTTSDAFVNANDTTDYWDEAAENGNAHPNITPSATSSEVLVMVSIGSLPTSSQDASGVMRVERAIGANPTCGSSTQIGDELGWFNSNLDQVGISAVWVDAPATTSNVTYTLCSDSDSTDTTFTIESIDFTLYEINNSADLAEVYATNDLNLEGGDLVELDPNLMAGVQKTSHAQNMSVLGVVSTKPSKVIGGRGGEGASGVPIALTGRAPIKVSTMNGEIEKGDLLTTSPIPGVAMKATDEGYMVGRALAEYKGEGVGSVLSFVATQYANPNTSEFGSNKTGVVLFSKNFTKEPTVQLAVNPDDSSDSYYATHIVSKSKSGFSYKVVKVSNGDKIEDVTKSTIVNWTASE